MQLIASLLTPINSILSFYHLPYDSAVYNCILFSNILQPVGLPRCRA